MNDEQASSIKELAFRVMKVLKRLEWECPDCQPHNEDSWRFCTCKTCNKRGKLYYSWTPQVGEWFTYGHTGLGLITKVRGKQWLTVHDNKYELYIDNGIPILDWQEIERVLEKVGYIVDVWNTRTGNYYCEINDGNDENKMYKGAGSFFQEAVIKAVLSLGRELK